MRPHTVHVEPEPVSFLGTGSCTFLDDARGAWSSRGPPHRSLIDRLLPGRGELVAGEPSASRSFGDAAITTPPLASTVSRAAKRAIDLVGATVALALLSPLLIVLTLALAVESAGHPIFVQRRVGRSGVPFRIFKFRTMARDADERLIGTLQTSEDLAREWATLRKLRNDPRVTRLGRLLRKYSLDELPQFVNVLLGQMSLVGPRPIVEEELPLFGSASACRAHDASRPDRPLGRQWPK